MRIQLLVLLVLSAARAARARSVAPGRRRGAGGSGACQAVLALDRSCTTSADCVAVSHTTNCCGQEQVFGLRASEQARFSTLEAQCDLTYPACGCAAQQPLADDGSRCNSSRPRASLASRANARLSCPTAVRRARRERPVSAAPITAACSRHARRRAPAAPIVTTPHFRSVKAAPPATRTGCSARHRTSRATRNSERNERAKSHA